MSTNWCLVSTAVFPMLLLGACRGEADIRSPTLTLQDSLDTELLALSPEDCTALNLEYVTALEEARVCDPSMHAKQCTVLMADDLGCPCVVFVNPRNSDARVKMRATSKAWDAGACSSNIIDCPAIVCQRPTAAECVAVPAGDGPGTNGGACLDVF